jgi:hypothetical protein
MDCCVTPKRMLHFTLTMALSLLLPSNLALVLQYGTNPLDFLAKILGLDTPLFLCKLKLSCYSNADMKAERRYSSNSFLTSAQDGISSQQHMLATLYSWEWTLSTNWTGSCVGLRDRLDTEARGKILCPATDWTQVVQSVVWHYTDWATPAPNCFFVIHNIIFHILCCYFVFM